MKWKDKDGKEVGGKEFMSRWKKGIEGVTPLQQIKVQVQSTWIMILGILLGFVIAVFNYHTLWWLGIILFGALGNTTMQLIGLYQKRIMLQQIEDLKGGIELNGLN